MISAPHVEHAAELAGQTLELEQGQRAGDQRHWQADCATERVDAGWLASASPETIQWRREKFCIGLQRREVAEQSRPMMDGQDLDLVRENPIDDPITLHDDLADLVSPDLRDHATGAGEVRQTLRHSEDASSEELSVPGSVPSDEQADGVEVIQRLFRPGYFSQWTRRRRASSCETFCPASA